MRVNTVVWADLSVLYVYLVGLQGTPLWSSRCRNWFICTCVCVFLYIHMCVSVHFCGGQSCLMQLLYTLFVCVCTRTCMWVYVCGRGDQRSHSSIDFNCSLFYFLKHNLSLTWGSQTQLERLTSESLDWPVSPIAGITAGITVLWGLRNELKSLRLYSKHFTDSAIFPTLFPILGCQVPGC